MIKKRCVKCKRFFDPGALNADGYCKDCAKDAPKKSKPKKKTAKKEKV